MKHPARTNRHPLSIVVFLLVSIGCRETPDDSPMVVPDGDAVQTVAPDWPGPPPGSVAKLRADLGLRADQGQFQKSGGRIAVADLSGTSIVSLEPLRGLPLSKLAFSDTRVSDLRPLESPRLELLYATGCPIESLDGLEGSRIGQLNLIDCPIVSLEPLANARIGTLWLRNCPVRDLTPLATVGLTSLDVQDTPVADLKPLRGMMSLRRLNIANTEVTDLRPLAGLSLQRLILSPRTIVEGMDTVRAMPTLEAIDTSFDGDQPVAMPAAEFWQRYDAGEFAN